VRSSPPTSARDFILVHEPKTLSGFAWDPGVESRRSDRSPLHDVRQRRHRRRCLQATQTDKSRTMTPPGWWSQTGSNRRPPACKAGALPTELWPRRRSRIRPHAVIPDEGRPFRSPDLVCLEAGPPRNISDPKDFCPQESCKSHGVRIMGHGGNASTSTNCVHKLVGLGRLERPTSPLSGVRSNHLSYRPESLRPRGPTGAPLGGTADRGERRLVREEREA
jgi:hypothetical protein